MKVFQIASTIDKEFLEKFILFFNENRELECLIIVNSGGGDGDAAEAIIYMINKMPNVTLFMQAAYSCAFELAWFAKCKKILSQTAKGMWHYSRLNMAINTKEKTYYSEDECMIRNLPIERKSIESVARKIMTAKEYKEFKENKDIYFDMQRMKQIFPDAQVVKF